MVSGPRRAVLGFHRAGRWDELVPVETCHIASPAGNDVRRAFERWAREIGLAVYDGRAGEGYLRHLVVREGAHTGQLLAMLVTGPAPSRSPNGWALLPEGVVGVAHAENPGVAEATAGLEAATLFGADRYEELVGGLRLAVTAGAFMQTNTMMSERLYELAMEYARLSAADVAWDLYCGAVPSASRCPRRRPGVRDRDRRGVGRPCARERRAKRHLEHRVHRGRCGQEHRPAARRAPRPDVVFVDPPRAGLTPKAVKRVLELAPERIVYVSCNPTTLAPNARTLVDGGYALERARPVDMFPHTPHIECVALLRRATTGSDPNVADGHKHHSRATASSTSAQRSTDDTSTHSSTAWAPAPEGPNTTVGMPAAERRAASIQAAWPIVAGSRPSTVMAWRRTASTIGASAATWNGARSNVERTRAPPAISTTCASTAARVSPGTVRRSIRSRHRSG